MKRFLKIFGTIFIAAMLIAVLVLAISADTKTYVAKVDGVSYETEAEAVAAIKEGSSVELLGNFTEYVDKSGVGFTVNLGEFTLPGFVSETHKPITDGGVITLAPALENEIFTVKFEYGEITADVKAALGTYAKTPSEFSVYPKLNEATKDYTVLNFTVNGGNAISSNTVATPSISTVPAVVILWTAEDGKTLLDTDYYFPGEKSALPEFSGNDIQDDVSPEWYSFGRVSWNADDVLAAEAGLSDGGEYKIRAVMGRKAPDVIPGLKINLTLYSNYVLNFYIPEARDGVENLTVATTPDGSISVTKLQSGTIEGERYERFSYLFGAADTRLVKFYVVYSYEGEKYSYEMEYGVPTYAAAAMQLLPCDAALSKTLIINMANYADNVLTLLGSEKTDLGARVYLKLLELYGNDYLNTYKSLANEKFLVGGEIYESDNVAEAKKGEAMKYVDGLSFNFDTYSPAYLLKPSSEALAIENFKLFVKYGDGEFTETIYNSNGGYYSSFVGNSETEQKNLSLSKMTDSVVFEFRNGDTVLGSVKYSLAAYINSMLSSPEENRDAINAAKAIYSFSLAAKSYSTIGGEEGEALPCMDFNGDHLCDVCAKVISVCHDTGSDHLCDVCKKKLSKLCLDENRDFVCDVCGVSTTYKHVIVIGVDGAGAFFRDTPTPNIDKIFKNGAITYEARTEIPSISAQNWGSILHGVKAGVHGCTNTSTLDTKFPANSDIPSFLRVVKEAMPEANVASITNWANISYGMVEDGLGIYMPYLDTAANNTDRDVTDTVLSYVNSCDPTLVFIQYNEVDTAGHGNGYGSEAHLNKITTIDSYIGEIYDAYEKKGILDETLFIITADHGGTPAHVKENGSIGGDHGGTTDAEMNVMFAAAGKTVQEGTIGDMELRDTAATVLYAFGLAQPEKYTARVPSGIFGGVKAPAERPAYVNPDSDRYHESEPTPDANSAGYITNFVTDKELAHYFPFDDNANDVIGSLTAEEKLNVFYNDAYFGKGVNLEAGHVKLPEFSFGEESATLAFWLDTRGAAPDPVILGNKDWGSGRNYGFALVINQSGKLILNIGDGTSRYDFQVDLPDDYRDGPVHVILAIDKENSKLQFIIDFNNIYEKSINETMLNVLYSTSFINIGQDGTEQYYPLTATLDELMFFRGAFTKDDVADFAKYYGKKIESIRNQGGKDTPAEDSEGYIGNYLDKYIGKDLVLYMPFDSDVSAVTGQSTTAYGNPTYESGFFGEAIRLKDGAYATVDGINLGTGSYTFSFFIKMEEAQHDPCIIATKNWYGAQKGFLIATKIYTKDGVSTPEMTANFGNGTSRADVTASIPANFLGEGWMHMAVVVDKTNNVANMYFDFKLVREGVDISAMAGENITNTAKLVIGQQLNGAYDDKLNAALDELMVFEGAFGETDIRALSKYYGVEKLAYGSVVEIPEIPEEPELPEATIRDHVNVPTPEENTQGFITDYLVGKDLVLYMPFDSDVSAVTGQSTTAYGSPTYEEGFYGNAIRLKDGSYATVDGINLGAGSYTFSFFIKMEEGQHDPCIIATKNWSGAQKGFLIATKLYNGQSQFTANFGTGSGRMDISANSPADFNAGWMHVAVTVDKTANLANMYFDFKLARAGIDISAFASESITNSAKLVIGQQLNGAYEDKLNAALDELMVFEGAFGEADMRALAKYFGVEKAALGDVQDVEGMGSGMLIKQASVRNPNPNGFATPDVDSEKHVTNFIDKNLELYVNFDDANANTTATGQGFTASAGNGSVSYENGVFGNALRVENGGYATVDGLTLGAGSYTFSFWIKMENPPTSDPAIISTKDWNSGAAAGFIVATKGTTQTIATLVNGSSADRVNCGGTNPANCHDGWMHVTVVVDKENMKMSTFIDFKLAFTQTLKENLKAQTITQTSGNYKDILRIGQDLEANYSAKLNAALDELMVFEGALSEAEVRSLSAYYGLETIVFG